MKFSRIVDIHLFFKSNGCLSKDYYNKFSTLDATNTTFYSTLSTAIATKKRYGIAKTTIDEFLIPKEMWEAGIWEKSIVLRGTGLCEDNPGDICAVDVELAIHIGSNNSILSGINIEFDKEHDIMKVFNIDVSIDCNTIKIRKSECFPQKLD